MKHSERFTNAVTKLYNAFHNGTLNAMDCAACACGNICDNSVSWSELLDKPDRIFVIAKTGYSELEINRIESIFMFGKYRNIDANDVNQTNNNDLVFTQLCAVVEYLCELEGIPNVMDYSCLFETENNHPKYKLEKVFAG